MSKTSSPAILQIDLSYLNASALVTGNIPVGSLCSAPGCTTREPMFWTIRMGDTPTQSKAKEALMNQASILAAS
jgi:hypothetical protein